MEGERFFDLVRTDRLQQYSDLHLKPEKRVVSYTSGRGYVSGLAQNPGY